MKRLLLILTAVAAITLTAMAGDRVVRDISALPAAARTTISQHFANRTLSYIKIDSGTFGVKDYEVVFSDGTEVEFDRNGRLQEVVTGRTGAAVPSALVATPITNYVRANYPGTRIDKLDLSGRHIEVELSNGVELKFDKNGRFIRVDD